MHCASQPTLHTLEMGVAFEGYVENVSSRLQEEGEEGREEHGGGLWGGKKGASLAAVVRCRFFWKEKDASVSLLDALNLCTTRIGTRRFVPTL